MGLASMTSEQVLDSEVCMFACFILRLDGDPGACTVSKRTGKMLDEPG